uniref:AMP-binding protein n=1 Tax=Thaumasiovibrio occultus TaxID=1891184 RepID=UPI000D3AB1A6|nr:AMP-binding protein [Thaumasiovibrio occultus]
MIADSESGHPSYTSNDDNKTDKAISKANEENNSTDNRAAIISVNETQQPQTLSWQELTDQVSCLQQWLVQCGVTKGDVVAGYLPNTAHAVIAMLATTSLGAIWTSAPPEFGIAAVCERFGQVKPKVVFACAHYQFNGKQYSMAEKNAAVLASLPCVTHVCMIDNAASLTPSSRNSRSSHTCHDWYVTLSQFAPDQIRYCVMGFNDPLYMLYSSGTTGQPKCIVHSVGGTLLNHLKEHRLHCDIHRGDRVFYYTTCGWMMWNWLVSTLASGATLVLYDGHPFYPQGDSLWQMAETLNISLFGTSAKYLEQLEARGIAPINRFQLPDLRSVCSTGSVLNPSQFDYVYRAIKPDVHLASISGGTDICGCFVLGNPLSPVYRGECQGAALGMDVAVHSRGTRAADSTEYTDSGSNTDNDSNTGSGDNTDSGDSKAVNDEGNNKRGELICRNSFPNQPLGFWHDNGEKYHHAYWQSVNGVWSHGDEVMKTRHQGFVFFGRSDATLNPGGVRIGTAEIYRIVNQLAEVIDCVAAAKKTASDEAVILFVQLAPNLPLTTDLQHTICQQLKQQASPRHVPAAIYAVSDIPRTYSGKISELAVKAVINGEEVKNTHALVNAQVLREYTVAQSPSSDH